MRAARVLLSPLAVLLLLAAGACGSDDDGGTAADTTTTEAPGDTTTTVAEDDDTTTTTEDDDGDTAAPEGTGGEYCERVEALANILEEFEDVQFTDDDFEEQLADYFDVVLEFIAVLQFDAPSDVVGPLELIAAEMERQRQALLAGELFMDPGDDPETEEAFDFFEEWVLENCGIELDPES